MPTFLSIKTIFFHHSQELLISQFIWLDIIRNIFIVQRLTELIHSYNKSFKRHYVCSNCSSFITKNMVNLSQIFIYIKIISKWANFYLIFNHKFSLFLMNKNHFLDVFDSQSLKIFNYFRCKMKRNGQKSSDNQNPFDEIYSQKIKGLKEINLYKCF